MAENNTNILNLDKLLPEARKIIIGSKTIDVSVIPTRVSLELMRNSKKFEKLQTDKADELFDEVLDICVKIIKPSFPEVNREWLIDNTKGINALSELINFTLKPLIDLANVKKKKQA